MDYKDLQGLTQEQLNEIAAAYYAQQIEITELRHDFNTRVQNRIAGRLIAETILRLLR